MKKRLFTLLVCIAALSGANAATMNSQSCFVNEADTAEYVPSTPVTPSTPDVPYEPLDTGEIAPPVQPGTPTVWVPVIREEDNVTEYPHNPAVDEMISSVTPAKQEFTLTLEGDYLRIKGTLEARGYDKHYIHCQIIGDSVHLQRFDMDPVSTDMLLHYVDIFIPGFTEDYYHVTLAEQNDVDIYKQSMVMKPLMVTRSANTTQKPDWVGAIWSYTDYNGELYSFIRYTVLDQPEVIEGKTYYPLVQFSTDTYEEGKETERWRIRQEGDRIYVLQTDYYPYRSDIKPYTLQVCDNDYLLYDFGMKEGEVYCTYGGRDIQVVEKSSITNINGQTFELTRVGYDTDGWLKGIGSLSNLMYYYREEYPNCICGRILNYFRSADGSIEYKNLSTDIYIGYKEDDTVAGPNSLTALRQESALRCQTLGESILFTSPDAVKTEVYTLDAVKVGEAPFHNGQAMVTVNNAPAACLYIVTYPDGRRESGKVMVR